MTYTQAVVLGVVQGLTEFLPVSSSGHLILVPHVFGWPDQGLAFDAAVHLGTSLALLCWFGRELVRLGEATRAGKPRARRLVLAVVVGSVPAGLAGLLLERTIETHLRSAAVVAWSLIGWGLVLWWADRRAARATVPDLYEVGIWRALVVGVAQAVALVPGTSRSGITITAGLFTGLDRPTAARFAFLLGLPITAAAGLVKTSELLGTGIDGGDAVLLAVGVVTSFAAGLAAVWFLLRHLQRRTLAPFVAYRIVLALMILWRVAT
jgi:undecaprenyl-diphosphatase